jgi:glycosyltransferase involved in cell wall biosynthesis
MKKKKVALIGNMNNNHFPLLRYLLDRGYDAELLILKSDFQHFQPEADSFQNLNFPIVKSSFSVFPSDFWSIDKVEIRKVLNKYDFLLGTGPAPALCHKAGLTLDLFIPYGSDIYRIPFSNFDIKQGLRKTIKTLYLKWHQKLGIKACLAVLMDYTNPSYEQLFKGLSIEKKRILCNVPFFYTGEFSPKNINKVYPESIFYTKFKLIRDHNDIVVFHHSRHEWLYSEEVLVSDLKHTKGNQKLITAFAKVVKRHENKRMHLVLFEYGQDVDRSKRLIKELDIEKNVTWFPIAPRKEIMVGISLCDVGVGELDSSYFSYGVVYEFLAMAKPVIHYRDNTHYKSLYETMYPMYSANTTQQVEVYLEQLVDNKGAFEETGRKAHEWFLQNAIERPLSFILNKIEN